MVRPIDLQDNLSKTQAAERVNQIQKAHGEMGQRQVADALKEKASAETERPRANEKTDMVTIRTDQKKEGRQRLKKGKDTDKEEAEDGEGSEDDSSEHLDLRG